MLRELHIKNIAVIEEVTVEFNNGFQALTGETGAGKSILIDSINMALGGRSNRELIRTGADFASVDLTFEADQKTVELISELGVDCEDETILISRKLSSDGKSKCYINGRLMPLNILKEAGAYLITIHGQNDNQSILSPSSHIGFVDEYSENEALRNEYKEGYSALKETEKRLSELNIDEAEKERLTELLTFQISEIEGAKLKVGEEEDLEERKLFLQNAESIAEGVGGAYYALYGDESDGGACDALGAAIRKLEQSKDLVPVLSEYYDRLTSAMADVEDVTHELNAYLDGMDYSQKELDETEGRLSLIYSLKRKYGNSVEEILDFCQNAKDRLSGIESGDELRRELQSNLEEQKKALSEIANRLSDNRREAAIRLQESIMNELCDLDMQKMRFCVKVVQRVDDEGNLKFSNNGCDDVEFLISANPGESLKPLLKIASGGEMSRIMLAIKSVLSDCDNAETMIFDEIDTGVSGRAAQKIAEKMGMLAKKRQLLCITHLAQIAAMADNQYLIEKQSDDTKTVTTVKCVEGEERVSELARIIGGVKVTDVTLNAAKEMLDMADSYKA